MFHRLIFAVVFVFCTATNNSVFAQSYPDSLELYDPYSQFEEIRAILMNSFSALGETNTVLVQKYKSELPGVITAENRQMAAQTFIKIGDIYIKADRENDALSAYFSALALFEEEHDSASTGVTYLKIGKTYLLGEIVLKTDYINKGYELLKNSSFPELRAYALYAHTEYESDSYKIKSAYQQALSLQLEALSENPGRTDLLENLSTYYNALGKFDEAIETARKSGNNYLLVLYLNNYGYEKLRKGNYSESLKLFFESQSICYEEHLKGLLKITFNNIAESYLRMGEMKKAAIYARYAYFIEESLHREDFHLHSADLKERFETDKKEAFIRDLYQSNEKKTRELASKYFQNIVLFILLSSLLVIAAILYYNRRKLMRVNKMLNESIKKMEALYAELMQVERNLNKAQEIAHFANWEFTLAEDRFTCSKQFEVLFDISAEELSTGFRAALHKRVHPEDLLSYVSVINQENPVTNESTIDYRIIVRGETKWIRANLNVLRNEDGKILKITGTVQDITSIRNEEAIKIKFAEEESFTKKLLEFQENEKKRLAGEIHDSLGQEVLAIKNTAQLYMINEETDEPARAGFRKIDGLSTILLDSVRTVAFELLPMHLELLGLTQTISDTAAKIEETTCIHIELKIDEIDNYLTPEQQLNLYRIVQESMNNIIKHSEAKNASIIISVSGKSLNVIVSDDGKGFTPGFNLKEKAGFGVMFIQKRVEMLGGNVTINSSLNGGTLIEILIPLRINEK